MGDHRPAGVFEFPAFARGSKDLLDANIDAAARGATVIVGGGDTATVVANYDAEDKLSHVSTSGYSTRLLSFLQCITTSFFCSGRPDRF